ncbi:MAG: four helix bundle protein [Paludibacter sp.]
MKAENVIADKSKTFGIRIIRLYQHLEKKFKGFALSKQILRSGTSIGANVRESVFAQSTKDFVSKLQIALKETNETEFWLELLVATEYLTEKEFESIQTDCIELKKILISITNSTKNDCK